VPSVLSNLLVCLLFAIGLGITLARGPRTAFLILALPCTILLAEVPKMVLPFLPDPGAGFGAMYGILLGIVVRGGEPFTFRWNVVDTLVVLIALAQVVSSVMTERLYIGVSSWGTMFLGWLGPYFLARLAFQSFQDRRRALRVLIFCAAVIAFFALIETRLWPHFYRNIIHRVLGLGTLVAMAYRRCGFFRADTAFSHPIYLGNACVAMIGMLVLLGWTTGRKPRDWQMWLPIAGMLFALMTSISFGAYSALAAAVLCFVLMRYFRPVRQWLWVLAIAGVVLGFMVTASLWSIDAHINASDPTFQRSFLQRVRIIQHAWEFAATSGLWGYGVNIDVNQLGMASIDNAYLLFAMRQGWVYLILWLLLPVALAWRASKAFATVRRPEYLTPLAAGTACIFGVMVGMYSVWSAWDFVSIWIVLLGFVVTLTDMHLQTPLRRVTPVGRRSMTAAAPPASGRGSRPIMAPAATNRV
jgi:hypothetical protein